MSDVNYCRSIDIKEAVGKVEHNNRKTAMSLRKEMKNVFFMLYPNIGALRRIIVRFGVSKINGLLFKI